jgi:hypothetical protein
MKNWPGAMVTAAVVLAACGGNVVVDSATGTGGTGGATPTTSSVIATTTTGVTTTSTTVTVSSSGGPCVSTCSQAINQANVAPCGGPALSLYDTVLSCACTGSCQISCTYNVCLHQAVSASCAMCLAANCVGNYQICLAN